mgnify:CR=1 FL=1
MGLTTASAMDDTVQFRRATLTPDAFGGSTESWSDHGAVIHCLRQDVKDTEAVAAGVFRSRLMSRFHVRSTPFTRDFVAPDKATPPADAAKNLLDVLDGLTPDQTGGFFDYAGREIPW